MNFESERMRKDRGMGDREMGGFILLPIALSPRLPISISVVT